MGAALGSAGRIVAMLAVAVLTACQNVPPSDPRAVWCASNEPRTDYHPAMPRAEVDKLNTHNRKGVLWCGWRP